MDLEIIRKFCGKRVILILKNGFKYTCKLPELINKDFEVIDIFGEKVNISAEFVNLIKEKNGS
jgi:hypothetical protein